MSKDWQVYVDDILESIAIIEGYVESPLAISYPLKRCVV